MPTDDHKSELLARWNATLPRQQELGRPDHSIQRTASALPHHQHLLHVLTMIDQFADDHDVFLVQLAAWFHDAVYAIPAARSATGGIRPAGAEELSRVGLEQEDLNQIARLVRLTETHLPGPRDPRANCCATRMAILASDPADYADYVAAVREEYAQLPEEEFLAGRLAVLTELADREIFRTAKGRQLADAARSQSGGGDECAERSPRYRCGRIG